MNQIPQAAAAARTVVVFPLLKAGRAAPREVASVRSPEARLEEAVSLTQAISVEVVFAEVLPVTRPRPATLIGQGAIETLKIRIEAEEITLAVFDCHLTPIQQRNLEKALNCKVIDRTALILEIFGERARTREGTLQVELAHLSYQRSRLVRSWTHLERQRGGLGFVGGPGETQIELDRRLIGERIARLKSELEEVKRTRHLHRAARKRVPFPVVALVGYTNAGKSTLFNKLTRADVFAQDMLFATLDPTMRRVRLPSGRDIILSDTVGFISDLPTELIAAFRATLEEVLEADLILHVRDVSHPDAEAQKADVTAVLADLGIELHTGEDGLEVANKIDRLDGEAADYWQERTARKNGVVAVSAARGDGIGELLGRIDAALSAQHREISVSLAHRDGKLLSWLYEHGEVTEREDADDEVRLRVRLSPDDLARWDALVAKNGGRNGD
ncbi:GTPase HflX [Oleispirillum naphthae]|uniref:GTPase HflX n=1 Tax=Oleispirillum naphthae TaxID=2838853 RepID=UPI0030822729